MGLISGIDCELLLNLCCLSFDGKTPTILFASHYFSGSISCFNPSQRRFLPHTFCRQRKCCKRSFIQSAAAKRSHRQAWLNVLYYSVPVPTTSLPGTFVWATLSARIEILSSKVSQANTKHFPKGNSNWRVFEVKRFALFSFEKKNYSNAHQLSLQRYIQHWETCWWSMGPLWSFVLVWSRSKQLICIQLWPPRSSLPSVSKRDFRCKWFACMEMTCSACASTSVFTEETLQPSTTPNMWSVTIFIGEWPCEAQSRGCSH